MRAGAYKDRLDEFNQEELPTGHEQRFEKKLEESFGKPKPRFSVWQIAAASIILISLAGMWLFNPSEQPNSAASTESNEEEIPMDDAKMYYQQSLNAQLSLIASASKSPEAEAMIVESEQLILALDSSYQELERELKLTGDQRVAAAMINNYKSRIQVLETLIQKINYVNQLKNENHENNAS